MVQSSEPQNEGEKLAHQSNLNRGVRWVSKISKVVLTLLEFCGRGIYPQFF